MRTDHNGRETGATGSAERRLPTVPVTPIDLVPALLAPAAGTATPSPHCIPDPGRFTSPSEGLRAQHEGRLRERNQALRPRMPVITALDRVFFEHFPKGGYVVQAGFTQNGTAITAAVYGRVHGRDGDADVRERD